MFLFLLPALRPACTTHNTKAVPKPQSITTVKIQRHRVRFLAKIKQETDKMSVSCYKRARLSRSSRLSREFLLDGDLLGGGAAVDVDAHEIDARLHLGNVQAVAASGLDDAAVDVEQFHALHPGVGTHDDVIASHIHLHVGQASLFEAT